MNPTKLLKQVLDNIYRFALTVLYYVLILPTSWWARRTGDPLTLSWDQKEYRRGERWHQRIPAGTTLDEARRQY